MAISLVQSATKYTDGTTPFSIGFSSQVTAGNVLVVCVSSIYDFDDPTAVFSISDNQNNTWHLAKNAAEGIWSSQSVNLSIFYAVANGNNTPTISVSMGGFDVIVDIGGSIYEYSGLDGTVNTSNTVTISTATLTPTGTTLTTTATSVIVAMAAQEDNIGTFGACSGGFTLRNSNGNHIDAVADYQNAVAGSYASVFSFDVSSRWVLVQVAFSAVANNSRASKLLAYEIKQIPFSIKNCVICNKAIVFNTRGYRYCSGANCSGKKEDAPKTMYVKFEKDIKIIG